MRKTCLQPLSVLLLLLLPATGLCEGIAGCATIAGILSVYPPMTVRKSEGPVGSFRNGGELPGCRVQASCPTALISGEVDPADALRIYFAGTGWSEDDRLAADGPGVTAFVFRKGGISCRVEGGAHSWIEGGKTWTAERYDISVECARRPE